MIYVTRNRVMGSGWGGFVTIGALFSFMAGRQLTDLLEYDGYYYGHKGIAIGIGILGLLITLVLGSFLNRKVPRNAHTVLRVPIQYWSIMIVFLTLVDLAHRV